ncbi:MAG: hypothetical protein AVDCRST_MAG85-3426 [uncultured Solirubrobacteraceae bacterium]|uniref:Uncharacterized protein n=1 Tax=uncultured Solirubrobacteraceae bacterium TaxID=1162706 RepID=A0A6J4TNS1_9ACTN|nr:MAG: hypothetical protein AVDCRST_MAG85-3426 [uncultured Solirubrobacteraceae bacterium]
MPLPPAAASSSTKTIWLLTAIVTVAVDAAPGFAIRYLNVSLPPAGGVDGGS